jgi:acetoin:2,6-dichlorophenolindophenol oxidoreductase subunit alpha
MTLTSAMAASALRRMLLIRRFEEAMVDLYRRNLIPGFIHPGIGEEAVHAGVQVHLRDTDHVGATHRGHGQALAKGVDPARLMAEVLGRRDGVLGGRGGSLHAGDWSVGCLPASSLVGGHIATMTGTALGHKDNGDDGVAVCYLGDGALNRGSFHEAANLAAIWHLPIVYAVIDNGWAISVPRRSSTAGELVDRARAYGMPGGIVDGKDILACADAAGEAVARAREGGGPAMLFFDCPRGYGHEEGDAQEYRDREEYLAAVARDPIPAAIDAFRSCGLLDEAEVTQLREEVEEVVRRAVEFGLASPEPDPADASRGVRPSQALEDAQ